MAISRIKYEYNVKTAGNTWLNIMKQHVGDKVAIEKDTKNVWNSIIRWCMGESTPLDNTKGIGLIGRTGSGKTMAMHVMNDFISIDELRYKKGDDYVHLRFKFESALYIASEYSRLGYDALYKYANCANLCIDDLGAENTSKKHFGDAANVIQELIEMRHSNGLLSHFTSNLKPEMIAELYGDRVYSRLVGTCNILTLNDNDYRIAANR